MENEQELKGSVEKATNEAAKKVSIPMFVKTKVEMNENTYHISGYQNSNTPPLSQSVQLLPS